MGQFRVVLNGQTLTGVTAEQAAMNLAGSFRIPLDRALSLVGRQTHIKRNLDQAAAQAYVSAIERAGFVAWFELEDAPAHVHSAAEAHATPPAAGAWAKAPRGAVVSTAPPPLPAAFSMNAAVEPAATSAGPFLTSIGFSHLAALFDAQRVTADMVHELTDQDLINIGVVSLGERKKIMAAARSAIDVEREHTAIAIDQESDRAGASATSNLLTVYAVIAVAIVWFYGSLFDLGFGAGVALAVVAFIVVWVFFLPTQVAFRRQGEYRWLILIGNCFIGPTLLGWVILMVLALQIAPPAAVGTGAVVASLSNRL